MTEPATSATVWPPNNAMRLTAYKLSTTRASSLRSGAQHRAPYRRATFGGAAAYRETVGRTQRSTPGHPALAHAATAVRKARSISHYASTGIIMFLTPGCLYTDKHYVADNVVLAQVHEHLEANPIEGAQVRKPPSVFVQIRRSARDGEEVFSGEAADGRIRWRFGPIGFPLAPHRGLVPVLDQNQALDEIAKTAVRLRPPVESLRDLSEMERVRETQGHRLLIPLQELDSNARIELPASDVLAAQLYEHDQRTFVTVKSWNKLRGGFLFAAVAGVLVGAIVVAIVGGIRSLDFHISLKQ